MLATLSTEPFDRPGWVYEEKYDGYRLLSYKEGPRVTLLSRNGIDKTAAFSQIAAAIAALRARTLLLDGEAVAFDRKGASHFQFLQRGAQVPTYAAFDCLYVDGRGLAEGASISSPRHYGRMHPRLGWASPLPAAVRKRP